jgi:hypothetical protein
VTVRASLKTDGTLISVRISRTPGRRTVAVTTEIRPDLIAHLRNFADMPDARTFTGGKGRELTRHGAARRTAPA